MKKAPEQNKINDLDSTYTSTSRCIGQIRHYIAKEKKHGDWEAINCLIALIDK